MATAPWTRGSRCVSLELFAPRSSAGVDELLSGRLDAFAHRGPRFISVSGAPAAGALRVAEAVQAVHSIRAQLHVERRGATRQNVISLVDAATKVGVRDVLVLGGAPGTLGDAIGGDFKSTLELVTFIKGRYAEQVRVAVCGYPAGTSGEAGDFGADLRELTLQATAGAACVVCLPCFDAATFTDFHAACEAAGVRCEVLPGLLPLREAAEFRRVCRALHVTPPAWLEGRLASLADAAAASGCGDELFRSLARELAAAGHPAVHVYTLNAASTLHLLDTAGYAPLKHRWASSG